MTSTSRQLWLLAAFLLLSCLSITASSSPAADAFRIEGQLYVFRSGDFESIRLPGGKDVPDQGGVTVRSPAVLTFDQESVSLRGGAVTWSGGGAPSKRFTALPLPSMITIVGRAVQFRSAAPVQYLEKGPDGSLQVKDIAMESPEAPHCTMSVTVVSAVAGPGGLNLGCKLELATLARREAVPGVTLPVGKPVLTHFDEAFDLELNSGEWGGRLVTSPARDYRLLLLLKVTPYSPPGTVVPNSIAREEDFQNFALGYYRNPQPDLVTPAMEWLSRTRYLDRLSGTPSRAEQVTYTSVGFFAEVFKRHPERVAEWQTVIKRLKHDDAVYFLRQAMDLGAGKQGQLLTFKGLGFERTELTFAFWGAFCASGEKAYLRELIARLALLDDIQHFYEGAYALVLLASNAPHHPVVRETMTLARSESAHRTRAFIDLALNDGYAAVLHKLRDMDKSDPYTHPHYSDNHAPWLRPTLPPLPKKP